MKLFGGAQTIREHHNAEQSFPLAENFLLDIRYAFRMLPRCLVNLLPNRLTL